MTQARFRATSGLERQGGGPTPPVVAAAMRRGGKGSLYVGRAGIASREMELGETAPCPGLHRLEARDAGGSNRSVEQSTTRCILPSLKLEVMAHLLALRPKS